MVEFLPLSLSLMDTFWKKLPALSPLFCADTSLLGMMKFMFFMLIGLYLALAEAGKDASGAVPGLFGI